MHSIKEGSKLLWRSFPVQRIVICLCLALLVGMNVQARAQAKKVNFLIIFGDDVGQTNVS